MRQLVCQRQTQQEGVPGPITNLGHVVHVRDELTEKDKPGRVVRLGLDEKQIQERLIHLDEYAYLVEEGDEGRRHVPLPRPLAGPQESIQRP